MTLSYEQGETIAFFSEGKTSAGGLMVEADLADFTCTGTLQKALSGSKEPDNSASKYSFQSAEVSETSEKGAGFRLTLDAAATLNIMPGHYVYERTVAQVGGHTQKTQRLIQIRGSVK